MLANAQVERLLGYSRGELLELSVDELLPERLRKSHAGHRSDFFTDAHARPMGAGLELQARDRDGREIPVEISLRPLETEEGILVSAAIRDISERKRGERAQAELAAIVLGSQDAVVGKSLEGTIRSWNPAAERLYGYRAQEAIGRNVSMLLAPGHEQEHRGHLDRIARGEHVEAFETTRLHKDGGPLEISLTLSPVVDGDGRVVGASTIGRDISERKRSERTLREAEERFRRAFAEAPIGMAMLDLDGGFVQVNDALCEITGYSREQLVASSLEAITHPDDQGDQRREIAALLAGDAGGVRSERRFVHAGQRAVWVALQVTLSRDDEGAPLRFLAQAQDITDRRRYEERLRHLADHDPLTGLLNRRSFEQELDAHKARKARYGGAGAAIVLDMDHFKFINDTLGHSAGDEAIIRAANVLHSRLRETDVLARLSGDEFAVLLPGADASEARLVAEALLAALRAETVELGAHARPLAASAGIALFESETASGRGRARQRRSRDVRRQERGA